MLTTTTMTTTAMAKGWCLSLTSHFSAVRIQHPNHHSPILHFSTSSRPLRTLHHSLRKKSSFHLPLVARVVDSGTEILEVLENDIVEDEEFQNVEIGVGSEVIAEDDYVEPPEEAKIFVGNLPFDLDSENLAKLFDKAGVVEIAEVIYNRETDQSRGFGFITMSTVEEAEKAVDMFNRYDVDGRTLTVNKAAARGTRPVENQQRVLEPSFKIYIGNLPWQVDDARLGQLFSEHGKVVEARVVNDRESGRSRGFGFVTMSSRSEVDDAIAALDGQSVDGRSVRVNVAEERPRRGSF